MVRELIVTKPTTFVSWMVSMFFISYLHTHWIYNIYPEIRVSAILGPVVTLSFSLLCFLGLGFFQKKYLWPSKTMLVVLFGLLIGEILSMYLGSSLHILLNNFLNKKEIIRTLYFPPRDLIIEESFRLIFLILMLKFSLGIKHGASSSIFRRYAFLLFIVSIAFYEIRALIVYSKLYYPEEIFIHYKLLFVDITLHLFQASITFLMTLKLLSQLEHVS